MAPDPKVGIRVIFKPFYVRIIGIMQAYFLLNQWHCGQNGGIMEEQHMLLNVSPQISVGPYIQVYPIWLD